MLIIPQELAKRIKEYELSSNYQKKKKKYLEGKVLSHCTLNGSPAPRKGGEIYTEKSRQQKNNHLEVGNCQNCLEPDKIRLQLFFQV